MTNHGDDRKTQNLVEWLANCYRECRTRTGVLDFFHSKVQNRKWIEGEERFLNGLMDSEPFAGEYGDEIFQKSSLYKREKEVVYASFFVCGQLDDSKFRAPLFFWNVEVQRLQNATFLKVNKIQWRLNIGVIDILDPTGRLAEQLSDFLSSRDELNDGDVGELRMILNNIGSISSTDALLSWPVLADAKNLRVSSEISVYAASAFCVLDRSRGSRGVIDELGHLSRKKISSYSQSMHEFLIGGAASVPLSTDSPVVPFVLSETQEKLVQLARVQPMTVCYGPPGTGKSVSLAAVAIDHVSRGESVLVVSKMNHAVNVIQSKIDELIGFEGITVRAGRAGYLKNLKEYLMSCLTGAETLGWIGGSEYRHSRNTMHHLHLKVEKLEVAIAKELNRALERGVRRSKLEKNVFDRIGNYLSGLSVNLRKLLGNQVRNLMEIDEELELAVKGFIRDQYKHRLDTLLKNDSKRSHLKRFSDGLQKRRSSDQKAIFDELDIDLVLDVLPVWLSNLDDLHQVLPLKKEIFDLVVIDEASQCDLASFIPALYRAKRVIVAGDPKQLRQVSFLSNRSLFSYADELNLSEDVVSKFNYREKSVMDQALDASLSSGRVVFLSEHFRSSAEIIGFSSKYFYRDKLNLMRHRSWENEEASLFICQVDGSRDHKGVNQVEIDQVMLQLRQFFDDDSVLEARAVRSIGILSPFRNQVDALIKTLDLKFSATEVQRLFDYHDLAIATAHGFQGEERDVMLLSFAVSDKDKTATLRFIESEDVFNVSITRARHQQVVFSSIAAEHLPTSSLLRSYFNYCVELQKLRIKKVAVNSEKFKLYSDPFFNEVSQQLELKEWVVMPQQQVAGVTVDIVVKNKQKVVGIDLIGQPGEMSKSLNINRMRLLRRAGVHLIPIDLTEWQKRKEDVVEMINTL